MSNFLRVNVVGPGLIRSDLVINYMISFSKEEQNVTITLSDTQGHNTRVEVSRIDAPLYQVRVTPEDSLDSESFSLASVLEGVADPEEEEVAPPLQPLEDKDHE